MSLLIMSLARRRVLGRFMPPGSAAIELFPYHFDHTLYPGMAALMGVAMYPVHSINGSTVFSKDKVSHGAALAINLVRES
jgi:hypothetical protein